MLCLSLNIYFIFMYFQKTVLGQPDKHDQTYQHIIRVASFARTTFFVDNNLFADLMFAVKQHVALTHSLEPGNPKKFSTGTPQQCWRTLVRTWQVAPSPERIVQDILRLPRHIQRVFDADGKSVPKQPRPPARSTRARDRPASSEPW